MGDNDKHPESSTQTGAGASLAAVYTLRTTQQHHVQLSVMADVKASILITACALLLSLAIGLTGADDVRASLLVLAVFSLGAMSLAVYSVLPRLRPGNLDGSRNLMFFGHFAQLAEEDYVNRLREVLQTDEATLDAHIRDIYGIGVYLYRHKYRMLRYAYILFLVGLVVGGVAEAIARLT